MLVALRRSLLPLALVAVPAFLVELVALFWLGFGAYLTHARA